MIGVLFMVAWAGALPAIWHKQTQQESFIVYYGEAFAAGTFLGASLLHMLPDALTHLTKTHMWQYPLTVLFCLAGFLLMRLIERIGQAYKLRSFHASHTNCALVVYILLIMLVFHSMIVGLSLGLERERMAAIVIMLALIVHKASAAFALSVSINRAHFRKRWQLFLLLTFSLATPLGIVMGLLMTQAWHVGVTAIPEGLFDALAAGTFLFMSLHLTQTRRPFIGRQKVAAISFVLLGFVIMATLAFYI
jgi:zinc transporter 1/2/3